MSDEEKTAAREMVLRMIDSKRYAMPCTADARRLVEDALNDLGMRSPQMALYSIKKARDFLRNFVHS